MLAHRSCVEQHDPLEGAERGVAGVHERTAEHTAHGGRAGSARGLLAQHRSHNALAQRGHAAHRVAHRYARGRGAARRNHRGRSALREQRRWQHAHLLLDEP